MAHKYLSDLLKKYKIPTKRLKKSRYKEVADLRDMDTYAPKSAKMLKNLMLDTEFESTKHLENYMKKASKEFRDASSHDRHSAIMRTMYNLPTPEAGYHSNSEILAALLERLKRPVKKVEKQQNTLDNVLGKVPSTKERFREWYEDYADNLLERNPTKKPVTDYLADDEANRSELLKTLKYHKRQGRQRAFDESIKRKEREPKTRSFTKKELKSKYFPAHTKRDAKFNLRDEQISQQLDKVFNDLEDYRESKAFKNFRGDSVPELTEKEIETVLNSIPESRRTHKIPQRTKEFEDVKASRKKYITETDENGKTYYPDQKENELIEKSLEELGIPHTTYTETPTQVIEDALHAAEIKKYLKKPQKLIRPDDVYDGYSFKDFYDSIEYD